jgi:peroxidase
MHSRKYRRPVYASTALQRLVRRRPLRLDMENLEDRCLPSTTGFRPIDEVGNNIANPTLGTAGTDLLRLSAAAYADGVSAPSLPQDPSARVISDILNNQANPADPSQDIATIDQNSLSDFGYVWGQFIDHDMDLTPTASGEFLSITADPNDPSQMGNQTFERSSFDPATGTSTGNPRQQVNAVTSFLDLSQVYGSTAALADALRTHSGGLLKTSPGNMLPYDNSTYFTPAQLALINMANDSGAVPTQDLFVTGDVRGNENVELTALQTLFVRNHNLIAGELQKEHPGWSDEQLYQEARKLNIAEYQNITYTAYLPALLGPNAMPAYAGYNPKVDPAIATEFSTVAFRFGHSLLSGGIERQGNNGQDISGDPAGDASLSLAQDFFDPNVLNPAGVVDPLTGHVSTDIDAILKGDADGDSNAMDLLAINDIRNLLFANGGQTDNGQDLMARDVERARDDGIGSYNQVRVAMGLKPVTSFAQITSNVQVQQELQQAYGNVNNIDAFEGGLAEDHVPGSDMGPLFTKILVNQFTRLRSGDRFFYLNETWNQDELNILRQGGTLAKVIEANTGITNLQSDVFHFQASISGTVSLTLGGHSIIGVPGVTVELLNSDGVVVATTKTDFAGHYRFTQLSGPSNDPTVGSGVSATGDYNVVPLLPRVLKQTTPNPSTISISRGDTNVRDVNFGVTLASTRFSSSALASGSTAAVSDADGTSVDAVVWALDSGMGKHGR